MSGGVAGAWRLDGANSTLLLLSRAGEAPEIVHWGARLPPLTAAEVRSLRDRAVMPASFDTDVPFATLLPTLGAGAFGSPALVGRRERVDGDWSFAFTVESVEPSATRLAFRLADPAMALWVDYAITMSPECDVITTSVRVENRGTFPFTMDWLAAGVFLLPARVRRLTTLGGRWGAEFQAHETAPGHGMLALENRRGRTSHDRLPLLLAEAEDVAEAWAVHLAWSGNHRSTAERLPDGSLLLMTGPLFESGEMQVGNGGASEPVLAYAAYSPRGAEGVTRALHAYARGTLLDWPGGVMRPRPVTLNTWEATYFEHDEARLRALADAAARLGVERFVLDDGWMKGRRDDGTGLGDWVADPERYPDGLAPLARHVARLGMEFGLWVEPEMANSDSDAARAHPDQVLQVDGRRLPTARRQVVLDLTRDNVRGRIRAALQQLLDQVPIAYLKWDMNRDLGVAGDAKDCPAYHRQILAVHALLDRLRADNPVLEIESCASGGGRPDWGMLARTHRVWASDCTDALDRLSIQRGALALLPPEVIGAHVSASPNHQTGRRHTLAFRCAVALLFHMGVELDPLALEPAEFDELAAWIGLHKRLRPLLHASEYVALPLEDSRSLLGAVAVDRGAAAYLVAQEASPLLAIPPPLRLPRLDADARYRVTAPAPQRPPARVSASHRALFEGGVVLPGGAWAAGFVPPPMAPESALVLHAVREGD